MKRKLSGAITGVLLAVPLGAFAQQPSRQADPADPGAAVPAVVYASAITRKPPADAAQPTPDQVWRAANAAVAASEGHAGHGAAAPARNTAHAGHAAAPAPAPKQPAAGHGQHH